MQQQLFGAALLIGVAITGSALAADIPGNATTKAVLKLGLKYQTGLIDRVNDADWYRVTLVKGKHYAFQVDYAPPFFSDTCYFDLDIVLADAKGRVLARSGAACGYNDGGFELTIAHSGVHFVRVSGKNRGGYKLRAAVDALNSTSTKAILLVNKPVNGTLLWGRDQDYFRIHLSADKFYTLNFEETARCDLPSAELWDKSGNLILDSYSGEVFSVPTTDDYFVRVTDYDREYECSYRVSVTD
jgi:hypothetical protein